MLPQEPEILRIAAPYSPPTKPEEVEGLSLPNSYMPRILELTEKQKATTPNATIEEILFKVLSTFGFGEELELIKRTLVERLNRTLNNRVCDPTVLREIKARALKAVFPTIVGKLEEALARKTSTAETDNTVKRPRNTTRR